MRRAWAAVGDLRGRLVRVVATDDGKAFERLERPQWTDAEKATLAWVRAAMAQYVEHDGDLARAAADGGVAGLGGLGCVGAWGMDLHRMLGFLASDWIASGHTTRSSDYVHFLLEAGLWTPDDAVDALVRRHVNQEPFFSHREDTQAERLAAELPEPSLAGDAGREDLRHLECYTIDPPDAKDFDDAVGIEALADGATRLWVHIADVSHYVEDGGRLDRHARDRATSVYLPGRVLPMLPHRVADHLCSLRADGDRFALSAALTVAADGVVHDATFHRALIRVRENLSYEEALHRGRAGREPFATMFGLADRMRSQRRGLDLDTGEIRVQVEQHGFTATEKRGDDATRLIETFMVAANEAVARHLDAAGVALPFRCHPLPDAAKSERTRHQFATMGFDVALDVPRTAGSVPADRTESLLARLKAGGGSISLFGGFGADDGDASDGDEATHGDDATDGDDGTDGATDDEAKRSAPAADRVTGFAQLDAEEQEAWLAPFRAAVVALRASPDPTLAEIATWKLLSCMGQAYYAPRNIGHFGLASPAYCHFTSPIRRYPDLIVHRNLKWLLARAAGDGAAGADASRGAAGTGANRGAAGGGAHRSDVQARLPDAPPHDAASLAALADHCSDQERRAQALERTVKGACLVLASLHGETAFDATSARIAGMTPTRVFLTAAGIDASTAMRDLPGGPYEVDEWESMLFLSPETARQRFGDDARTLDAWHDDESGEMRVVRARLGDRVSVRLAGRDVAAGRTDAVVQAWGR
jgi:exoribonuclease R